MVKQEKEKIITFGAILIFCIIVCSPLLQMHMASDTYNLMDLGYLEYPSNYFLKDARIISTFVTYLAGLLNLNYPVYIVSMEIIAILITSISIYILYQTVISKIKDIDKDILKKILILMATILIIFNCISIEYLLYAECSIMCLSVLLCIIASKVFTSKTKLRYLKSLLLVLLATFCYQGSVNIFMTLVALLLFIDKDKIKPKEIIKQIILSGTILVICFLANVIAIYVINYLRNIQQTRLEGKRILLIFNIKYIVELIKLIINYTIVRSFDLWPRNIIIIFVVISSLLIILSEKKFDQLLKYLITVFIALTVCILPVFLMKSPGIEPRTSNSIGSIIGISLIFLNLLDNNKKIWKNIIIFITISFFIYNCVHVNQIFTAHIVTNKVDQNIALTIKYKIEKYEKETGNIIKKVAFCKDENHRDFPYGYPQKYASFTQQAYDNDYCSIEALNYYCDRDFEKIEMPVEQYKKYFQGKNWDGYSEEQIVFEGDTMYFCTY